MCKLSRHLTNYGIGYGETSLTLALQKEYPNAAEEWIWQYIFPSGRIAKYSCRELMCRYHLHEIGMQKSLKQAARIAKIENQVGCHIFRHSFATHLLKNGYDILTV